MQAVLALFHPTLLVRIRDVLRAHLWFLLMIAAYAAALLAISSSRGFGANLSPALYATSAAVATPTFAVAFLLWRTAYIMIAVRPQRLTRHLIDDLRSTALAPERLLAALPIFLVLPVFMSMFSSFKVLIPTIQPFAWDATFAEWDRVLHFGRHPWEWLQPILGHPYVTAAVNFFYNLWFFVMYGVWMWQAFSTRDPALRMRYFLSFVLLWAILGTGLATLFSSAGPCYFGRVTGLADPYAGLMAYLNEASAHAPVWSLAVQESLWTDHLAGALGLGSGISAMPSLHVATAVLFALLGWQTSRRLGIGFTAFAVIIMVGSVHLGWHYAVDGYVSAVATVLIWKAVGWFLARDRFFRGAPTRVAVAAA